MAFTQQYICDIVVQPVYIASAVEGKTAFFLNKNIKYPWQSMISDATV